MFGGRVERAHLRVTEHYVMAEWLAVISITVLAVISPGPDFAMVTRNSLVVSQRAGLLTALGIGLGVLIHVAYTNIGIGLLMETSLFLFWLMKTAGAAYLIFLGVSMFRSKPDTLRGSTRTTAMSDIEALRVGFFTNALNPKTMIFIVSLFLQVIHPTTEWMTRVSYGLFVSFAHVVWFGLVALFFATPVIRARLERVKPQIDRGFGVLLIVFGAGLLMLQGTG